MFGFGTSPNTVYLVTLRIHSFLPNLQLALSIVNFRYTETLCAILLENFVLKFCRKEVPMVEKKCSDPLEDYLAQTIDLRSEPALMRDGEGWKTLDGTPHVPLLEVAQESGRSLDDLKADFDAGKISGVRIGDQRYARQGG